MDVGTASRRYITGNQRVLDGDISVEVRNAATFLKLPTGAVCLIVGDRAIGGLGVMIVKKLMDSYKYKRSNDKNIVTLKKLNINS